MKTLRARLMILVLAGIGALALLAGASAYGDLLMQRAVQRSLEAKDLTADILPPPLYLVEMRLVLGMAIEGTLPASAAVQEHSRLAKEYADRVAHWTAHPPKGLEKMLQGPMHAEGLRFIDAAAAALKAASVADPAAEKAALRAAHAVYLQHRTAVDRTVKAANELNATALADYEAADRQMSWLIGLA